MAVYEYEDDDVDLNDSELPKKLRAVIKELKKENADLAEKYGTLQRETRTRSITEQVTARGLNPKVAALIPQDADVEEWLNEYGDVLGFAPQSDTDPEQQAQAVETRRMAQAEQGASAGSGDIMAAIANAENMDDLMNALRAY